MSHAKNAPAKRTQVKKAKKHLKQRKGVIGRPAKKRGGEERRFGRKERGRGQPQKTSRSKLFFKTLASMKNSTTQKKESERGWKEKQVGYKEKSKKKGGVTIVFIQSRCFT